MSQPTITLYVRSQPTCQQCNATKRRLDAHGLSYVVIDLADSEDPKVTQINANIQKELRAEGYQQVPVVKVIAGRRDLAAWSGHQPDKIDELVGLFASYVG